MTDLALDMRRVEYAYRRDVALRGISLAVRAGEVVPSEEPRAVKGAGTRG
jgi:putative ABC transport system ATP-binding protein